MFSTENMLGNVKAIRDTRFIFIFFFIISTTFGDDISRVSEMIFLTGLISSRNYQHIKKSFSCFSSYLEIKTDRNRLVLIILSIDMLSINLIGFFMSLHFEKVGRQTPVSFS